MSRTLSYTETLQVVSCTCGINYAIPEALYQQMLDHRGATGKNVYCPLGHSWFYVGKTDAELEREKRQHAEARLVAAQDQLQAEKQAHTKTKKRITNGVCPCCHRTFQQLARHMKAKHPNHIEGAA